MTWMLIFAGAVVLGFAGLCMWAIEEPSPVSPRRSLQEVARLAANDWFKKNLPSIVGEIVEEEMKKPEWRWFRFVKAIQWHLHNADKSLPDAETHRLAMLAYRQFLEDEKCEFGDPRFAWNSEGAKDLAHEYEIAYWEAAA